MTTKPLSRYQFSLRWMLRAFFALACLFAAAGYLVQKWNAGEEGRRVQRMNNLILSNGGYWGYQGAYEESPAGNLLSLDNATRNQVDTILRELKAFDGQVSMSFSKSQFYDTHVAELVGHHELTTLNLDNTLITDNGLKELASLKELIYLQLNNTVITDAGLEHLVELPELQYLSLDNDVITVSGLKLLAKLPKLKNLHVNGTKVTDERIAELKRALPDLEVKARHGM